MMDLAWVVFLATRPRPKLAGRTCQSEQPVDLGAYTDENGKRVHRGFGQCKRPVWGDGTLNVQGFVQEHNMCSQCWHNWNAFHGIYVTFKANPASLLNASNVDVLRFQTGNELPESDVPDNFPDYWSSADA